MNLINLLTRRTLFFAFLVAFLLVSIIPLIIFGNQSLRTTEDELKSSLNQNHYLLTRHISHRVTVNYVNRWIGVLDQIRSDFLSEKKRTNYLESRILDSYFDQIPELVILSVRTGQSVEARHILKEVFFENLEIVNQKELLYLFDFLPDSCGNCETPRISDPVYIESVNEIFIPLEIESEDKTLRLRAVFRATKIFDFIQTDMTSAYREIYVLDSNRRVLFANQFGLFARGDTLQYGLGLSGQPVANVFQTRSFVFKNEEYISHFLRTNPSHWIVLVVQPNEHAYALVAATQRNLTMSIGTVLLLCLIMSFLFAWFHSSIIVRAKKELQSYAVRLEKSNAELEAFAHSVAHDLSAPLRYIKGYAEILSIRLAKTTDETSVMQLLIISNAVEQMNIMIQDLLAFARIGYAEVNSTRVDLKELIDAIRNELTPLTKDRNIYWELYINGPVWGDPTLLHHVFSNLIGNAVKFTGRRKDAVIEIHSELANGNTVISVKDNGIGFDNKNKDKIFGLFQRLHSEEEFPGSGVGLANVRRIVKRHGGRIWAEGEAGHGASFYVSIPAPDGSRRKRKLSFT